MQIFRLVRGGDGMVSARKHIVSDSGNGHGIGLGDLNGDDKQDIVFNPVGMSNPRPAHSPGLGSIITTSICPMPVARFWFST